MQYLGEQLLPGQIGHLLAILSFVASLTAAISYFVATQRRALPAEAEGWRNIGRGAFFTHGLATLGVIGTLFFILVKKRYEYQYAWANIADDLPVQYVFSAFWKEQQGSFLLWSFWNIVLGLVLVLRSGKWEAPVLAVVALAEVFIASMLLGLYFGDYRFGASPFDLLRDTMDAPIFAQADYLSKIQGNGLNPLLQNYWMTIHPPTLFLGFASTIVPCAFAIAGLWTRNHQDWLRPALQWACFSGAILGTGILMGGAWAYEALSFAGYWAWDPVENTSLVPWLVLVAGLHTNLVAQATGYSIRSTYAYYILSFILVLYSTYLTRSGVLGDTSVHSFTEMGLGVQLVAFIATFKILGLVLWGARYKEVPETKPEEAIYAREFWMFVGALVLFFSGVLMTGATSLPVWNKIVQIFKPEYDGITLADPIEHHNRYQLWIAVFIGLLAGLAQFLRYGERNWNMHRGVVFRHLGIGAVLAGVLTPLVATQLDMSAWQLFAFLFAGLFAIISNLDYLATILKGNLKLAGSVFSHLGFGILLIGILFTGLNKRWISSNSFAMEGLIQGLEGDALNKNVLLMKDAPLPILDNYTATYISDTLERQTRTFRVDFQQRDAKGDPTGEVFSVFPNVMYDRQFSKIVANNPSTQHYLTHDIFTLVSSLPIEEMDREAGARMEDSLHYQTFKGAIGDTIRTAKHALVLEGVSKAPQHPDYKAEKGDLAIGLRFSVWALDKPEKTYKAQPILYLRPGKGGFTLPAKIGQLAMRMRLNEGALERLLKTEDELRYQNFGLKEGGSFVFNGYTVRFAGVERDIKHPNYTAEPNDIAVAARLDITGPKGEQASAAPIYLIRGNQPFSLKDEVPTLGLHFRFDNIDPKQGVLTIAAAQASDEQRVLPFDVAEDAPRSDYIVMEAIIFPGIKLVWIGSILMLLGLGVALWRRRK